LKGSTLDWGALFSTLGLIFVAELGDKTQLAVVTQTCKYRRPWAVFAGASLALVMVTLIGALGGQLLSRFVPVGVLRTIAALAFIVMGGLIGREASKAGAEDTLGQACDYIAPGCTTASRWDWKAFSSSLGLLFVAELGDKTQLAVLSLSSKHGSPWAVFVGGALALTLVTAIGVVGGQGLCRLIPERLLLWISATAFVVMGILMGLGIL
jgi:putative Ca2+/H+ antiporter (TMEM165/GDT1 family)